MIGCGTVITRSVTLSADVGPCPGEGIVVVASGITVDLGGHRIIGNPQVRVSPDKAGVVLRTVSGVTLRNGTVRGFDAGVAVMGGGHDTIRGVTARANVNYRVVTGRDVVRANTLVGNGPFSAVALIGDSNENVVSTNDIRDNDVMNETPQGEGTTCGSTANGPVPDRRPRCRTQRGRAEPDQENWAGRRPHHRLHARDGRQQRLQRGPGQHHHPHRGADPRQHR